MQVVGTGSFTRADGSTGVLADAVFSTGARADGDARVLAASGNNAVLLAAVAAAGLASSAAAAQPGDEPGGRGNGNERMLDAPLTQSDRVVDSGHEEAPQLVSAEAAEHSAAKPAEAPAPTARKRTLAIR